MSSSFWRRLVQFRLRTLLLFVTLCAVAGGAFLAWWRTPFVTDRRTSETRWEHLHLLQALLPPSGKAVFRERARVYRDFRAGHVNHGPLEVFDGRGRRLRLEHWSHGALHGPWIDWDLDGAELARGEYWKGERHGDWVIRVPRGPELHVRYVRGAVRERKDYRAGRLRVYGRYDERGKLVEASQWEGRGEAQVMVWRRRSSVREGASWEEWEAWYPDGGKRLAGKRRDGLEAGAWVFWNADGSGARKATFDAGRLVGNDGALTPPICIENPEQETPEAQRIRETLDCIAWFEFGEARLCDVLPYLEELYEIPIRLNEHALVRAGFSVDTPVTPVEGVPLRAALQIMLHDLGLAPVVRRDVLLVTTLEDAAGERDPSGITEVLTGPSTRLQTSLYFSADEIHFEQTSLRETLAFFREKQMLPVRLDEAAFEDAAAVLDSPTTLHLPSISLACALGCLLDQHNLSCVEANGELLLRPREE